MQTVHTPLAPAAIGPYSQAVQGQRNGLYVRTDRARSETGAVVEGGIKEQTTRICESLKAVLTAAGSSLEKVVKTTCFLADMADFAAFNEVYGGYFTGKPARSCVCRQDAPQERACGNRGHRPVRLSTLVSQNIPAMVFSHGGDVFYENVTDRISRLSESTQSVAPSA